MSDIKVGINSSHNSLKFDLQSAIRQKDLEAVKSVLVRADELFLETMSFNGMSTPLGYAIYNKFDSCVQLLLETGADPNQLSTDAIGRVEPPLCAAIRIGELKSIKLILRNAKVNIHKWDVFLQTPTYLCVRYRRTEALRLLVNHRLYDLRVRHNLSSHLDPLQLAVKMINKGRIECFVILVNIGFHVQHSMVEPLLEAGNQRAIRMAEMSMGRALSADRQFVASLKQLSRNALRNAFLLNTYLPVVRRNIDIYFPILPNNMRDFLTNLERLK